MFYSVHIHSSYYHIQGEPNLVLQVFPLHSSLDREIIPAKIKSEHLTLVPCFQVIFLHVVYKTSETAYL